MSATNESGEQLAFEYAQEASMVEITRFYFERVAFTRRGNFAFVAGMLMMIYNGVSYAVATGTPSADVPIYASSTSLLTNMLMALDAALAFLIGLFLGFGVLFALDLYEAKFGLSIDPDH